MSGILISLALAIGMFGAIGALLRRRTPAAPPVQGQLTAAERRRLYKSLGINPAALARQRHANVVWLDPHRARGKRTDA
jgi:hypothetical protein